MPPKTGCSKSGGAVNAPKIRIHSKFESPSFLNNGNVVEEEKREGGFQRWGLIRSNDLEGRILYFSQQLRFFSEIRIGVEVNAT